MAIPTPDQLIPRALVRERIAVAPPAGSLDALARTVVEKTDQGNWRQGLELGRRRPVEANKISQKIEEIGGFDNDRNPDGSKNRSAAEIARHTEATNAANLAKKFLDQGFNSLTPGIGGEQEAVVNMVLAEARLRPAIAAELTPLTAAQQRAYAERLLKDPKFHEKARALLEGLANSDIQIPDAVTPARQAVEDATLDRDTKQEEVADIDRRLVPIDAGLAQFTRPAAGAAGPIGAMAARVDMLRTIIEAPTFQTELASWKTKRDDARQRLNDLRDERMRTVQAGPGGAFVGGAIVPGTARRDIGTIDGDITAAKTALDTAEQEVADREGKLQALEQLKLREQELNQQKQELENEKRPKKLELDKAELELKRRQQELKDAQVLRASQEQDVVDGFKHIFAEATNEVISEQIDKMQETYDAEAATLKQQAEDQNEQAMYDALQEGMIGAIRYRGIFRREAYRPLSRAAVGMYYDILLTQGPEEAMTVLLTTRINPATGVNYTAVEAHDLMRDKAEGSFYRKLEPEVVKQILAKRMLSGGGINQEAAQMIVMSNWGQGMLTQAIAKRNEFRAAVEELMGADALGRPGFFDRMALEVRRNPWLLLLALGLAPLTGGLAAAGIASAAQLGYAGHRAATAPIQRDLAA